MLKTLDHYLTTRLGHGRIYMCGDFNQAPAAKEVWDGFLAKHHLVDVVPLAKTYSCASTGKFSALDRWLVRDYAIEQQRVVASVHASRLDNGANEHARLTVHFRPIVQHAAHLPKFQAIPASALTPALEEAQDLACTLENLPDEITAQRTLDMMGATAWTWWKNLPKGIYAKLARSEHLLRRAARTRGPTAIVPAHVLESALKRVEGKCNLHHFAPLFQARGWTPRGTHGMP